MSYNPRSLYNEFQVNFNVLEDVISDIDSKLNVIKNNGSLDLESNQIKMSDEKIIKTEDGAVVRKVFVTNIDRSVSRKDLTIIFEKFGPIHDVFIKTCDSAAGTRINVTFGFVTFYNPTSAYNAIKYEKPLMLKHRRLKVRPADTWHQPVVRANGELNYDIGINAIESSLPLRREKYTGAIKKTSHPEATTSNSLPNDDKIEQVSEIMTSAHINILNDDCFTQLFSYFTLFELIELEQVCIRWHNTINLIWQRIHRLCTDDLISQLNSPKLTTDAMRRLLVRCGPYLKSLKISSDKHAFNSRIHQVISKSCPHLETLHLSGVSSNAPGILALSRGCKKLKTILFKNIPGVQDHILQTLFKENPNLESVHIEGGSAITGRCLRALSFGIHEISLINCNSLQLKELKVAFRNMKYLKSLTFESCMTLTSNFLVDVADCFPNLDKFSLNKYYPLMHNKSLNPIVKMTNITVLSFSMNTLVSDTLLEELSQKCINVTSLDLSSCSRNDRNFTVVGLHHLAKFPKLSKVYLSYMEIVTGDSLEPLANRGNLIHLEVRACLNLSDAGPIKVFEKCNKLESMDISGCDMITIEILTYVLNMIKSRNNNQKLKLIIGGSGITDFVEFKEETERIKNRFAHPNLEINFENLSVLYLRPDFFDDYFPDSDDDLDMLDMDYDDEDDFDDDDFFIIEPEDNFPYFAAGALFNELIDDFLSDDDYY